MSAAAAPHSKSFPNLEPIQQDSHFVPDTGHVSQHRFFVSPRAQLTAKIHWKETSSGDTLDKPQAAFFRALAGEALKIIQSTRTHQEH